MQLVAQVVDQCTSCPAYQFNLPYPVWVANLSANANVGTVPVQYRRVRMIAPKILPSSAVCRPVHITTSTSFAEMEHEWWGSGERSIYLHRMRDGMW